VEGWMASDMRGAEVDVPQCMQHKVLGHCTAPGARLTLHPKRIRGKDEIFNHDSCALEIRLDHFSALSTIPLT
jgi:hypothetical protein